MNLQDIANDKAIPQIASCVNMITKSAHGTYRRLTEANRRWLSLEDLIQDGFLAALNRVGTFDASKGAKYSTYLFRGLTFEQSSTVSALEKTGKRAAVIVELDAPRGDGDTTLDLPSTQVPYEDVAGTARAFVNVYKRLSRSAATALAGGLLCGRRVLKTLAGEDLAEIQKVVRELGVSMADFKILGADEKNRKKILHSLVAAVNLDSDIEMEARILECIECKAPFSLSAIKTGKFVVDTMTCRTCYKNLQQNAESCFGKQKTDDHEGYSQTDVECRLHCKDRKICPDYIKEKKDMSTKTTAVTEIEELDELDAIEVAPTKKAVKKVKVVAEAVSAKVPKKTAKVVETEVVPVKAAKKAKTEVVEATPVKTSKKVKAEPIVAEPVKIGKTKAKTNTEPETAKKTAKGEKTVTPAKAETKAKAPKSDDGPKLPFKKGSMMRYLLELCMAPIGAKEKKLEAICAEHETGWKLQRKSILNGWTGKNQEWKWKVDAEGGVIKISNIKYEGKAIKTMAAAE